MTGMRRNEVLGLKWSDIDVAKKRLHLNRGLVAVADSIGLRERGRRERFVVQARNGFELVSPSSSALV